MTQRKPGGGSISRPSCPPPPSHLSILVSRISAQQNPVPPILYLLSRLSTSLVSPSPDCQQLFPNPPHAKVLPPVLSSPSINTLIFAPFRNITSPLPVQYPVRIVPLVPRPIPTVFPVSLRVTPCLLTLLFYLFPHFPVTSQILPVSPHPIPLISTLPYFLRYPRLCPILKYHCSILEK
ncbi:hypothetical protein Pcinc_036165 [Petrolisthes cinctipes]|uniref:Uncharacterized protein n=1 Tax=Petrolisthes cinctipes TaxID=88211 RepID=A0AAE1ENX5_PETCI|nr:hypothetical protein Pcinc_036165 [Petrolisthes cinctipes]